MVSKIEKINILKKCSLFSGMGDTELNAIANIVVEMECGRDEILIQDGDTGTSLYLLVGGKANALSIGLDRKEIVHNEFKKGDYFGEMSFVDKQPRCGTVRMMEPGMVLKIPGKSFGNAISSNPDPMLTLMKGLIRKIRSSTQQIEDLVFVISSNELHDAHLETIRRLVLAAVYKDYNTANHIIRVSKYSGLIAEKLELSEDVISSILYAAPMHDIGKIGIPERILLKPGSLTYKEFNVIKTHTTIGAKILSNPKSPLMKCGHEIALWHHEKFNGKGYPHGLSGREIPLSARIVAVVDAFDAMVSRRPYKDPIPVEEVFAEIKNERNEQFDPEIVDVFIENRDQIMKIMKKMENGSQTLSGGFTSDGEIDQ